MAYAKGDKIDTVWGECIVVSEPDEDGWMIVEHADGTPTGLHVSEVNPTVVMAKFDTREVW